MSQQRTFSEMDRASTVNSFGLLQQPAVVEESVSGNTATSQPWSCRSMLLQFDYFKFEGYARPVTGPLRSITGTFGTILMLMCLLAYIAASTVQFVTQPPSVSVTQTNSYGHIDMVPFCVSVPFLADPAYFAYALRRVDIAANMTKTQVHLPMTVVGPDRVCVTPENVTGLTLRRFCSPGDCSILKFKLWNCGNPSIPPAMRRDLSQCAAQADIETVLGNNYVQIIYGTELGSTIVSASAKFASSSVYSSSFSINETTTAPDLLRTFQTAVHENLMPPDGPPASYALQYMFIDNKPNKEILEAAMSLTPYKLNTVNTHMTSLDLIGKWSAFFSVLSGTFALVFLTYNERWFFHLNPSWASLNGDFKVEIDQDE